MKEMESKMEPIEQPFNHEHGDTHFIFCNSFTNKNNGSLIARIQHPREGTISCFIDYDGAVRLLKWLENRIFCGEVPLSITQVYTISEVAALLSRKVKLVSDTARMNRVAPLRVVNKVRLYSGKQVEEIKKLLGLK